MPKKRQAAGRPASQRTSSVVSVPAGGKPLVGKTWLLYGALILVVLAAYSNHFQNEFQFDDYHTIVTNPNIARLANIPRFFVNTSLFTGDSETSVYRPVTSVTLAIDYWLAKGLHPFAFHLSTFVWFSVQLVLMVLLFRGIFDYADPHRSNLWTALLAAACYGLHPANAETVNYVIQRADVFNALGVVASLFLFAAYPERRRQGWYLLPAVAAMLAKAPALIFPLILAAYVYYFEEDGQAEEGNRWPATLRVALPALLVTAAAGMLTWKMTPPGFKTGAVSGALYRLTQPWVALHYFKSFFLPTDLSADTDWTYVAGPFSGTAVAGYLFVALLVAGIVWASRRRETKPIAFGLLWFILALLPTSLVPLAEVTNDHRMFFPFVGLALAVFWSARLLLFRYTARLTENRGVAWSAVGVVGLLLLIAAIGTYERNQVWATEESLWHDVTMKSPNNGRGWMNYGVALQKRGDYATGRAYLEKARSLGYNSDVLQEKLKEDEIMKPFIGAFNPETMTNGASAEGLLQSLGAILQRRKFHALPELGQPGDRAASRLRGSIQ